MSIFLKWDKTHAPTSLLFSISMRYIIDTIKYKYATLFVTEPTPYPIYTAKIVHVDVLQSTKGSFDKQNNECRQAWK